MKGMTLNTDIKIDKIFTGMEQGLEGVLENTSMVNQLRMSCRFLKLMMVIGTRITTSIQSMPCILHKGG